MADHLIAKDQDNQWAVGVAKGITEYIHQEDRTHRVMLSLSDAEFKMLKEICKKLKKPHATVARGCAMFGLAALIQADVVKKRVRPERVKR